MALYDIVPALVVVRADKKAECLGWTQFAVKASNFVTRTDAVPHLETTGKVQVR